jgi:hypothetical protein
MMDALRAQGGEGKRVFAAEGGLTTHQQNFT